MSTLSKCSAASASEKTLVPFQITDKKGRQLGVVVVRWTETYEALPADARSGYRIEPGAYLCAVVMATRDGYPFGAAQNCTRFPVPDEAAREAWILKRVHGTRRRYEKVQP